MAAMETQYEQTVGFIGLGRMGLAMTQRLHEQGIRVVATDVDAAARSAAATAGLTVAEDIAALVKELPQPSVIWVMVPSQFVQSVLDELTPQLAAESVIIDGGNSDYRDSLQRYQQLQTQGLHWLDCGTSGGVEGARNGASLMVGGESVVYRAVEWVFAALGTPEGYARVGGPSAGHFVKAVHNGIEYGMMGALAEGLALLEARQSEFGLDIPAIFGPYKHGSIISSRLLNWLVEGYREGLSDRVGGTVPVGETEHKMEHLVTLGDLPVLQAAIAQRRASREQPSRTGQHLSTMRYKFGGHAPAPRADEGSSV